MRTCVLLMASALLLSSAALAQESPDFGPEGGDWALQFQITEDFTLSDFQGSIVSVKYHSSDRSAWRAGLGLEFDSNTDERERTTGGVPGALLSSEFSRQTVRLDLQYLRYANPVAKIQFLFGGGPFGAFDHRATESFVDGMSQGRQESDRWEAGLSGLLGVEWFVASRLSLHAEYGLEFVYAQTTASADNPVSDQKSSQNGETWAFGARGVLLGVSAYF